MLVERDRVLDLEVLLGGVYLHWVDVEELEEQELVDQDKRHLGLCLEWELFYLDFGQLLASSSVSSSLYFVDFWRGGVASDMPDRFLVGFD